MMWLLLALGASAQEPVEPPDKYGTSLLKLATRFAAKEACSCVFVTGRDVDECALYLRVSPDIATFKADPDTKTVTARALGGWKSTARWVDAEQGCVLE